MRTRTFTLLAAAFLAAGCAGKSPAPGPAPEPILFPTPPAEPRIQFLARYASAADVEEEGRSFWKTLIGEREDESDEAIVKPYGVAMGNGRLYICDSILAGVEILDLVDGTFEIFQPRGQGQLQKPINCAVDPGDGRLFVTDTQRGQVVVFDSAGSYVGGFGDGEGRVPVDVFVASDAIFVADIQAAEVRAYDKRTFRELATYPRAASGTPEGLFQPTNLWVTDDRIYVSDFGDFKVKVYDRDGEFVQTVGSYGRRLGQFVRPKGIAVDRDDVLYVVDAGFQNVQMFDADGSLLMWFGGQYQGPGTMYLPAQVTIDYRNVDLFRDLVDPRFSLEYLVIVTNQYGPDKVAVYGFIEPRQERGE